MPVLATMIAVTLFGGGEVPAPFFEPAKLRELLTDGLEGLDDEKLEQALAIADQLEDAVDRYRTSVSKSIDAFVTDLRDPETDAADLAERLAPLDRERSTILTSVVAYRDELTNILDEALWSEVFG